MNGTISSNSPEIGWSSGNCTINSNVIISNFNTATALLAVGSGLGTLTNNGTIAGTRYGFLNAATIGSVTNNGRILALTVSAVGLYNNGAIGVLNNAGTISAGSTGIFNPGSIGTLINTGLINGSGGFGYTFFNGIRNTGTITELDNNAVGTVLGLITGGSSGIGNYGHIGTLNNSGVITASNGPDRFGINNNTGATIGQVTNNHGATISGGSTAFRNNGIVGTLSNSGLITGGDEGFANNNQVTLLSNLASGVIQAQLAVVNSGSIGTLTNSGKIAGTAGSAIGIANQSGGTISALTNSANGTIVGRTGISNSGILASINNSALITGSVDAINNSSIGTIGTVTNSGVIAGNITNLAVRDLNIAGGTGSIVGTLTGLSGAVGAINSTSSNVNFVSGNILLNDSINVGSNAVNNTGATLLVNAPMTITGNYAQGASATLQVGVNTGAVAAGSTTGDSGYGRLSVTGTANVASGSSVVLKNLNTYTFAAGQRFVAINALSAGTNYNQAALQYSIAGGSNLVVTGSAVADGSNSDLVLTLANAGSGGGGGGGETPNAPQSPVTSPNAQSAFHGLWNYTGVNPQLLNLFDASLALNNGSSNDANKAGKQLGPTSHNWSGTWASLPIFNVLNIIASHTDGLHLSETGRSGVSTGESGPKLGVWGQAFGGAASQDGRDQIDGYDASFAGMLFGADYAVSDNWRLGAAFSYANTSIDNTGDTTGDNTNVNSYGLTGYASYVAPTWYANLSAAAVEQVYDTNRVVNFTGFSGIAKGNFNGQQYVTRAEAGYPLAFSLATVTPLASLTYSYLHQDGYTETGGNGAALSIGAAHSTSVTTDFGAKIEHELPTSYGVLVPALRVGWRHEYVDTRVRTNASFAADPSGQTSFTTLGATPIEDSAIYSVDVTLVRSSDLTLTLRFDGQAGSGFTSEAGSLRIRQLF